MRIDRAIQRRAKCSNRRGDHLTGIGNLFGCLLDIVARVIKRRDGCNALLRQRLLPRQVILLKRQFAFCHRLLGKGLLICSPVLHDRQTCTLNRSFGLRQRNAEGFGINLEKHITLVNLVIVADRSTHDPACDLG